MSLYIKVQSSFWTHRKTVRLQALIGYDVGLWLPQRIWNYAAINQPDGDFSDYTAQEIAMLVAYKGDARAMLQALQQARFFDGMQIHDWDEHNQFHSDFAKRAKHAAEARWNRQKEKKQKKDTGQGQGQGSKHCFTHAPSIKAPKTLRPTGTEVEDFCQTLQLPRSDGQAMFLHWEEKGWAKVKDWKLTIRKWKSFGYLPSQKQQRNGVRPQNDRKRIDPSKLEVAERFKGWVAEKYPEQRESAMKWQVWSEVPDYLRREWWKEERAMLPTKT